MLKIVKSARSRRRLCRKFYISSLAAIFYGPLTCNAEPWANAGDERTRFHLQVLADSGKIDAPITSWPVMWVDIESSLQSVDIKYLSDREIWSYRYLKHEIELAKRSFSGEKKGYASNSRTALTDFASSSRERWEVGGSVAAMTGRFSGKLSAVTFEDYDSELAVRYDGSYLASAFGNWVLGVGAIDKWWGPGWQSSLVLSNNARPSPGFFLQRKESEAFSWPVFSWIGPWNIHLFANQLEEDRHIPNAKLLGGRMVIKPFKFLELGVSRVAQWGGEGRPENFDTFKNMVLGNDNKGKRGIENDASNEPGNQVFSFDWRASLPFWKAANIALYFQRLSEDKGDRRIPFQNADMFGVESSFILWGVNTHITYEDYDSRNGTNGIYEHGIYHTGYRTQGRNIGPSIDTSSLGQSLLVEHYFSNGHQLNWRLGKIDFNIDNAGKTAPGGHPYGTKHIEEDFVELRYKAPIFKKTQVQLGFQHLSESLQYGDEVIESNASIGFEYRW